MVSVTKILSEGMSSQFWCSHKMHHHIPFILSATDGTCAIPASYPNSINIIAQHVVWWWGNLSPYIQQFADSMGAIVFINWWTAALTWFLHISNSFIWDFTLLGHVEIHCVPPCSIKEGYSVTMMSLYLVSLIFNLGFSSNISCKYIIRPPFDLHDLPCGMQLWACCWIWDVSWSKMHVFLDTYNIDHIVDLFNFFANISSSLIYASIDIFLLNITKYSLLLFKVCLILWIVCAYKECINLMNEWMNKSLWY